MSLVLTIEQGPRAQAVRQARLDAGELVIGRSPEADWQIDDPDKFVSRAHCTITMQHDGYIVTDTSSSGLFIDGSNRPLGTGNTARLSDGMRLRLGDYVLGVEVAEADAGEPSRSEAPQADRDGLATDDFFSMRVEQEPAQPRPADLPNPFDFPEPGAGRAVDEDPAKRSAAFDDPFSMDPVQTPTASQTGRSPQAEPSWNDFGGGWDDNGSAPRPAEDFASHPPAPPPEGAAGGVRSGRENAPRQAPWELPQTPAAPPPPRVQAAERHARPSPSAVLDADAVALRDAFFRGLGIEGSTDADALAEMERFGREYRLMMEGLMQLLRKRAEEKGNARVAQTVVGASEVNPLKFLPTVDDAIEMLVSGRSPGFLPGDKAIPDAVRDLAQHHVRAWRGVQEALRRMIDRFDPAALEEELKSGSSIGTLLSGGRGAKLWELYQKRHREIAASAEQRFLGEIGADFRNAYEGEE